MKMALTRTSLFGWLAVGMAQILFGSNYWGIREFLPADAPLWGSVLRAFPAGVVLLLIARRLPTGAWWWKSAVLGSLNMGLFFLLLYITAQRLPSQSGQLRPKPRLGRLALHYPARHLITDAGQPCRHQPRRLCRLGRRRRLALEAHLRRNRTDHPARHRRRTGRPGKPPGRQPPHHRRTRQRAGHREPDRPGSHPPQPQHPAHPHQPPRPARAHHRHKDLVLRPYQPLFFNRRTSQ